MTVINGPGSAANEVAFDDLAGLAEPGDYNLFDVAQGLHRRWRMFIVVLLLGSGAGVLIG